MNRLTYILAFFILFLAMKPGMDALCVQENSERFSCSKPCKALSDKDKTDDQNQDNSCDGKACNPFQVCGSCVLICLQISAVCITEPTAYHDKGFTYRNVFTPQFTPDFWQPPKIV